MSILQGACCQIRLDWFDSGNLNRRLGSCARPSLSATLSHRYEWQACEVTGQDFNWMLCCVSLHTLLDCSLLGLRRCCYGRTLSLGLANGTQGKDKALVQHCFQSILYFSSNFGWNLSVQLIVHTKQVVWFVLFSSAQQGKQGRVTQSESVFVLRWTWANYCREICKLF